MLKKRRIEVVKKRRLEMLKKGRLEMLKKRKVEMLKKRRVEIKAGDRAHLDVLSCNFLGKTSGEQVPPSRFVLAGLQWLNLQLPVFNIGSHLEKGRQTTGVKLHGRYLSYTGRSRGRLEASKEDCWLHPDCLAYEGRPKTLHTIFNI